MSTIYYYNSIPCFLSCLTMQKHLPSCSTVLSAHKPLVECVQLLCKIIFLISWFIVRVGKKFRSCQKQFWISLFDIQIEALVTVPLQNQRTSWSGSHYKPGIFTMWLLKGRGLLMAFNSHRDWIAFLPPSCHNVLPCCRKSDIKSTMCSNK